MTLGLSEDDLAGVVSRFGVAEEQVRRDHLISHMLAAISDRCPDDVVFFGGTALSRTHLVHGRLSEDIDLIAQGPRRRVVDRVVTSVEKALIRTHGRLTWQVPFSARDVTPAVATTQAGLAVQVQILSGDGYEPWPTERREIDQRYADAPRASLTVHAEVLPSKICIRPP